MKRIEDRVYIESLFEIIESFSNVFVFSYLFVCVPSATVKSKKEGERNCTPRYVTTDNQIYTIHINIYTVNTLLCTRAFTVVYAYNYDRNIISHCNAAHYVLQFFIRIIFFRLHYSCA